MMEGRTTFPGPKDFEAAGKPTALYAALYNRGIRAWAAEFGVERRQADWTVAEIERRLEQHLAGRRRWPPQTQIQAEGWWSFMQVIYRYGGTDYWAERLGVEPPSSNVRRVDWDAWRASRQDAKS
jgi:hypothetical protein